jgi:hypothetical protein
MPSPSSPGAGGLQPRPVNAAVNRAVQVGVQPGINLGVVRARQVIIAGPGEALLVYSPAAGFGNLETSVAADDFTDQYGNAGLAGTVSYEDNGTFFSAVAIDGGNLTWYEAATAAGPWNEEASIGFGFVSGQGGFLVIGGLELQLSLNGGSGVIPQAGGSSITTVAGVVAALEAMGLLTP